MIEPTGFCWNCGHLCKIGYLFCDNKDKCKKAYERKQRSDHSVKVGKKAGYGLAGSTH